MKIEKHLVQKHFARAADAYERSSALQEGMAQQITALLKEREFQFQQVLEIGCGTGYLTRRLLEGFPQIRLLATDLAPEMVAQCKRNSSKWNFQNQAALTFAVEDGERLTMSSQFHLIVSNACFQWFTDLPAALQGLNRRLFPGGRLLFSTFGPETFHEMHASFQHAYGAEGLPQQRRHGPRFSSKAEIFAALEKAGFSAIRVERRIVTITCRDVQTFLRGLKDIGARNATSAARSMLNKRVLARMKAFYETNFTTGNGIRCTYELLFADGIKA